MDDLPEENPLFLTFCSPSKGALLLISEKRVFNVIGELRRLVLVEDGVFAVFISRDDDLRRPGLRVGGVDNADCTDESRRLGL